MFVNSLMTFVQKCTKECTKFVQNGFLITEDMSSLVFCVFIVVVVFSPMNEDFCLEGLSDHPGICVGVFI